MKSYFSYICLINIYVFATTVKINIKCFESWNWSTNLKKLLPMMVQNRKMIIRNEMCKIKYNEIHINQFPNIVVIPYVIWTYANCVEVLH